MSRSNVSMSEPEVREYLDTQYTAVVATVGPSGRVHLVAMWYVVLPEGIGMWAYATSQKVRNLTRDPMATILVESGEQYRELRGVEVSGSVRLSSDPDAVARMGHALAARYGARMGSPTAAQIEAQASRRMAIVLPMDVVVSWDHAKLP